jgi:hypothetical protein
MVPSSIHRKERTMTTPLAHRINRLHETAPWGRSTSYELVRTGRLPARRLGGATFVLHEDLVSFIKELPSWNADVDDASCVEGDAR